MAYWLFKSEPGTWSWDDQVRKGDEGEGWDGVRNYQAANNMKAMKVGDRGFFYHSVNEKQIVGIVEVIEEYHPDPTDKSERFGMVTIKAIQPVEKPVTLADIKAEPELEDFALVRQSRLSVVPVTDAQWRLILKMAETKV
ncbi:EVE domain-containing protein [Thalassobaculum sp. OXR-137]|uniref:EVE domain-containing protein n=1 Tax=Thalassobaculum sp. OXR-137 TaxID=3100173 RepID=UPI002AC98028|nr:EVE domain-containing protein [Thalassobaculum sp. OXR-137]WPZ35624.1 EVE domain-containing protein [Thalassobaculum sp. OXR-137]